jgi:predicted glycogen debranching enzyme
LRDFAPRFPCCKEIIFSTLSGVIAFDKETCTDFETALSKEWLETNGLGGFSSSTIISTNTRRYHALLVASFPPDMRRFVLVNALEEWVISNGTRFDLSAHQYPGVIHPRGDRNLIGFRLDPWPIWTYRIDNMVVEKSLTMIHGQNTIIITYKVRKENAEAELVIRPFMTGRPYHTLHLENPSLKPQAEVRTGVTIFEPYPGLPKVFMHQNANNFVPGFNWYRQMEYARERDRGLEFREDCWAPGEFHFTLKSNQESVLIITTEGSGYFDSTFLLNAERNRRRKLLTGWEATDDVTHHLVLAADQFLVAPRPSTPDAPIEGRSLVAGYPWFECWGRDTFIAMTGLLLTTQRFAEARDILKSSAEMSRDGLIPNRNAESGSPAAYNSVDTSLWFIVAVFHYLRYTKDFDFVRQQLWSKMKEIIEHYQNGTNFHIHMDVDGLIVAGQTGVQLTWMDAKVGEWVVTPRAGKPIEIQALWYNALRIMEQVGNRIDDKDIAKKCGSLAEKVYGSINRLFWFEEGGHLFDVVQGDEKDASLRPNQIFAVSLPFESVTPDRAERIVSLLEERLLTPFGLRTLDPRDNRYSPRYQGDERSRDAAYHQGTVWPWLMGPFLTAYQKVHGKSTRVQAHLRAHLALLLTHLWESGLGTISEIFDGDMPHEPRGCIAQAWSVAEVLRVLREELGTTNLSSSPRLTDKDPAVK